MARQKQEVEMVTVVGPSYRQPDGSVRHSLPPREIPKRQWDNPVSRQALVDAGIRLEGEIFQPSEEKRGPGRPTTVHKQLNELRSELEKLKAENESLKATKTKPDATKQA